MSDSCCLKISFGFSSDFYKNTVLHPVRVKKRFANHNPTLALSNNELQHINNRVNEISIDGANDDNDFESLTETIERT